MRERNWWTETVVYQVSPRSFSDSDGDGLGAVPGITEDPRRKPRPSGRGRSRPTVFDRRRTGEVAGSAPLRDAPVRAVAPRLIEGVYPRLALSTDERLGRLVPGTGVTAATRHVRPPFQRGPAVGTRVEEQPIRPRGRQPGLVVGEERLGRAVAGDLGDRHRTAEPGLVHHAGVLGGERDPLVFDGPRLGRRRDRERGAGQFPRGAVPEAVHLRVPPFVERRRGSDGVAVDLEDAALDEAAEQVLGVAGSVLGAQRPAPVRRPVLTRRGLVEERRSTGDGGDQPGGEPRRARDQIPPEPDQRQAAHRGGDADRRRADGSERHTTGTDERDVDERTRPTAVVAGVFRPAESGTV
ncbi:hypothetical protein EXE45_00455 [Halorubrum sp. SP9]|nr:hypothetical protein EXE45_00455 [Halorubrum sp. SP9]